MFEINDTKTFMDSIHGYISIPKCFVNNLVDTEYFQRLRNIDQTGMRILYPDARHDRFGHSLGVFHLGEKAVDSLLENFLNDDYWNISSDNKKFIFWAKNKVLFLIACLLHDIGHVPFSHSLEQEVFERSGEMLDVDLQFKNKASICFTIKLSKLLNELEKSSDPILWSEIQASPHEQLGAMLILEKFRTNIESVYDELIKIGYPDLNKDTFLYSEHYKAQAKIDKSDLDDDICFIARMILGLKYKDFRPERQIRNCFIELLNNSNFDVDKLDYIVRDTKMSGISNVSIDVERLLKSLSIVTLTKYEDKKFDNKSLSSISIQSISNDMQIEQQLYDEINIKGSFNGTICLFENTEIYLGKNSTFISLKSSLKGKSKIQYLFDNQYTEFSNSTIIVKGNNEIKSSTNKTLCVDNTSDDFSCEITNAKILSEHGFCFRISKGIMELTVHGHCDLKIKGNFYSKTPIGLFSCVINGPIKKLVVLGNAFKLENTQNKLPSEKAYNTFSIGFKKQAINIIANVLEARNYLYLWIYAHHKVIYYANFLLPAISKSLLNNLETKWDLTYENIKLLDDACIWTMLKDYYNYREINNVSLKKLCKEILERKYKRSLYKSLAEYDLFFESFTIDEKKNIQEYLKNKIDTTLPNVRKNENYIGGFLTSFLSEIKETDKGEKIKNIYNLVYVEASYKAKELDTKGTFLVFNNTIAQLEKIPLLKISSKSLPSEFAHYFYLYYDSSTIDEKLAEKETEDLREIIKEFFSKKYKN